MLVMCEIVFPTETEQGYCKHCQEVNHRFQRWNDNFVLILLITRRHDT